jgi:hypothetical protein
MMKLASSILWFLWGATAFASLDCPLQGNVVLTDGFSLSQVMNTEEQTVTVQLTYQGQGWIGMGFGTGMLNTVAVIGFPDENPALYTLGGYDRASVTELDDQSALRDRDFTQTETESILTFTLSLTENVGINLMAGEETSIIAAFGMSNTLDYHSFRTVQRVTFTECAGGMPTDSMATPAPVAGEDSMPSVESPVEAPVAAPVSSPVASDSAPAEGVISIGNGATLFTEANEEQGTIFFEIVYEGQGWIGFGVSPGQTMAGSEVIIGVPGSAVGPTNPGKYVLSSQSLAGVTLLPSEQQTLIDATIEQNETHTVLRYSKLMEEDGEFSLSADEPNPFVFATGISNALGNHNQRFTFSASVGGSASGFSSEPRRELWAAHGALMTIAWGILVPLAISCSLLRDLIPGPEGLWFRLHQFLNSLAITFTIVGFAIAVYAINDQSEGEPEHFDDSPKHKLIGLIIFILAVVQGLIAAFRPHLPKADKNEENVEQPKEKSTLRFIWEIKHRVVGFTLLGLSWYNVDSGLKLFADLFQEDDMGIVFWVVVGVISGLAILLFAFTKLRKSGD